MNVDVHVDVVLMLRLPSLRPHYFPHADRSLDFLSSFGSSGKCSGTLQEISWGLWEGFLSASFFKKLQKFGGSQNRSRTLPGAFLALPGKFFSGPKFRVQLMTVGRCFCLWGSKLLRDLRSQKRGPMCTGQSLQHNR